MSLTTDVLTIAVEGGIAYWVNEEIHDKRIKGVKIGRNKELDVLSITFAQIDKMDKQPAADFILTRGLIREAMNKIHRGEVAINPDIRDWVATALRDNDASGIDADAADAIVQIAIYGEIVFG